MKTHIHTYILVIVAGLMLATISACSSTKKFKTKDYVLSEEKTSKMENSSSSDSVHNTVSSSVYSVNDKYNLANDLLIEYEPTFDSFGKLIPFSYVKEENGNKVAVKIEGSAKVVSNSRENKAKEIQETKIDYQAKFDSISKRLSEVEAIANSKTIVETKTVEVTPDYIKYLIWVGIGLGLLSAILAIAYFKLRSNINAIRKITGV